MFYIYSCYDAENVETAIIVTSLKNFKKYIPSLWGRFWTDTGLGRMSDPYRKMEKNTQILRNIKLKNRFPTPLQLGK